MSAVNKPGVENLFRRQALRALAERPYGRPVCHVPRPWLWAGSLLFVLAAVAIVFALRAEFSRKERVRGWLVPAAGVTRISHDASALVQELVRQPGDSVEKGDTILRVSRDGWLDDGRSATDAMVAELHLQIAAIDERMRLLRLQAAIEADAVAAQRRTVVTDMRVAEARMAQQERRVAVAVDRLARLEAALDKGAVSRFEVLRQRDETLATEQALARLLQEHSALGRERQALDEKARRSPVEVEAQATRLREQQSRLRQQVTGQRSAQRKVITAPVAGRIASVEVREGAAIAPGQLLATIVPETLELVAEAYVPSSAVGMLSAGQRVLLSYDAFPVQQFGTFGGRITEISELVVLPAEIPATFALRQAAFRVRIELSDEAVSIDGVSAGLRPGMTLGAEIVVETNTLMSWLLMPLRLRLAAQA